MVEERYYKLPEEPERPEKLPTCPLGYVLAYSAERGYYCKPEAEIPPIEAAVMYEPPVVPEPPPVAIEPPVEIDLPTTLEYLYPEMFEPEAIVGISAEELPDVILENLRTWAIEEPETFMEDLWDREKPEEARIILRQLGATEEDIDAILMPAPFEIPPEGYEFAEEVEGIRKLFTIKPDYTVWLEGKSFGTYDPETGQILEKEPRETSGGFLDAIETGLQYIEGWWKTGLMEAGFGLYKGLEIIFKRENRWTSEAEIIMDSAYEKHGWKAIFSDEVNEAWDIYFLERQVVGPAKIVAEFANPIWWAGAGGLAGLLAKPFSKIPLLGKTLQGVAKTVQATEEVALLPLTAPLKGGIRFAGKAIGIKPTRPFLVDVLPTASELKSWLFKSDTFRRIAQHIPGMKWVAPGTVISEKLPATLIAKAEVESAVTQEILQRTAILELGQGTKGQSLAYLRELGTTKGILGVKDAVCSTRWVKPRFAGESLALGDVVQAPERYIFKHKSGLEYCKRAQQICREMYELATKEGVEIHRVGLEPFEEYVHWICVGKIGKDGVLQMGRRGTRAVGGIVPAMKHRRFEDMMDGIKAGYKYSDDLEIYVSSYVDNMFKAIGDKRLGDGLAEVIPRVEGMLPIKPLDRLIALYPEREIAWTGIRKEMADLGYAWSAIKRAARGEILPPATIRALERRTPEYAEKLAIAGTDRKALRSLSRELKLKTQELKPDWWKARFERSKAMEIVRKPILGREEGFIRTTTGYAHPMFQNQIYPRVIADQATKLLNAEAAAFFKVTAGISAAFRMQIAVLDISAWCIQGLMTQFAHPIKAMKANIAMIEALIVPRVFQQYLVKIAPSMNERLYYLGAQRPFEFFESMGWFVKMAGKVPGGKAVIGQTFGRAQASFSMWATVYKDLMWQACSKKWIQAGQGAEFARYLDRMTGMMSFNQLGMPANVSAFLAGWVSFAPQYRLSVISWFGHLFKGGMIGGEARKDLAKIVAGALISYTAFCKVTDNPVYLDPYKDGKKFLSIKVDGHWIGIGAAVVSMIRASVDITASALSIGMDKPMDFLTLDKWKNPLIRMWYGQSAVLPKLISEIATRRDYLGYPMESVEDWAMWAGEQVTPIWLQDIFFDESGVPVSPLSVLGNFAGLRTSPQTRWETMNDKMLSLKAWEVVTDLSDEQRERIDAGETVLSVLNRFQKAEMFNAFPELIPFYEEALADAMRRGSQIQQNYEMATTNIQEEAVDGLTRAIDVGVKLDGEDTRWLRDRYGDVMNTYGAKNDILRDVEEYQDMFDEWDEAREKRKPEAELVDLAYWEYIEDVVSPDYELPNGDFDFEAYDNALADFKDKWGEEIYDKILYILENNKAEYPDWSIKLWKDRLELNRGGYWKLPYKLISKMDEDDKVEGNIPEEYLALWEQLQIAKDKDAFIEANPILSKDWRTEFRLADPEADAMLALWGYGGKLQTREAYDLVLKWVEELGIPLEQMGLGLPPPNLIDNYFELNKVIADTSGGSVQTKLYKLEHLEYLAYGVEQWGWGDLADENVDILKLRDEYSEQFDQWDSYADRESPNYLADETLRAEERQKLLDDKGFRVARLKVRAFSEGYSVINWDEYVAFHELPAWGSWRDRFLLNPINAQFATEYYSELIGEYHKRPDLTEVKPLERDLLYQKFYDDFRRYDLYDEAGKEKMREDDRFYEAWRRVQAYDYGLSKELNDAYLGFYRVKDERIKKKDVIHGHWFEDDWFLIDNMDFYNAMFSKDIWKDEDRYDLRLAKQARKVWELYRDYWDARQGESRLNLRARYPKLDRFLFALGEVSKLVNDRGDAEGEVEFEAEGLDELALSLEEMRERLGELK